MDCFFDNVGGSDSTVVMNHMNTRGRISICGSISTYNDKKPTMAPVVQPPMVFKVIAFLCLPTSKSHINVINLQELRMEGFLVHRWLDRWDEGVLQMAKWIQDGKIKAKETIVKGFENTPDAFIGLFTGKNTGKMIVQV